MTLLLYYYIVQLIYHKDNDDNKEDVRVEENSHVKGYRYSFSVSKNISYLASYWINRLCDYNQVGITGKKVTIRRASSAKGSHASVT